MTSWSVLQSIARYAWYNPRNYAERIETPLMLAGLGVLSVGVVLFPSLPAKTPGFVVMMLGALVGAGAKPLGQLRDIFPSDPVD